MPFKADEKGDYCVTHVPAGTAGVRVHYNVTFDIIHALMGTGTVHAGSTTVIDVRPELKPNVVSTEKPGAVTATVIVGDGGEAAFLAGAGNSAAFPLSKEPASPPEWKFMLSQVGEKPSRNLAAPLAYTSGTFNVSDLVPGQYKEGERVARDDPVGGRLVPPAVCARGDLFASRIRG